MIRNCVSRLLAVATLLFAVAAAPTRAAVHPRALILYNAPPGAQPINNEIGAARMIGNLLGHFSLSADIEPASRYRRGGSAGYVALFYLQINPGVAPPSALAQDVTHLTLP